MARISIIGNSGSGKSTLAKALGSALRLPVYHLDRHLLTSQFEKLPYSESKRMHDRLIAEESWIIDGNYKQVLNDRIHRSTLVIFLDVSRALALPRIFQRAFRGGQGSDTIPDGAQGERLSWAFIRYVARYSRRERIRVLKRLCAEAGVALLVLRKAPVEEWIKAVSASVR